MASATCKYTYQIDKVARRAARLGPIGFDEIPPDTLAIPAPKARKKTRRTRKKGAIRTYSPPRKTRKAKPARFEAQTWKAPKGRQPRHMVIDMGDNRMVHNLDRAWKAEQIAFVLNREWVARRAVA